MLLCLVVCLTLLASFFLPSFSHLSLKHVHTTYIYMYIELLAYYEVTIHFISDKSLTFVTLSWPDLLYSLSEEMVGRGGSVGRRSGEVIPNTPPDSLQLPSHHQTPGHSTIAEHTVYCTCCEVHTVHAVRCILYMLYMPWVCCVALPCCLFDLACLPSSFLLISH